MLYVNVLLGFAFLSSMACRNSAIGMIEKIGANVKNYPKGYILPARWMRKIFKLPKHKIPWYLYIESFLSLFFAALGPVNLLISAIAKFDNMVVGTLCFVHVCFFFASTIFFLTMSFIWSRK